ncbi:MAG: hypothetical protein CSA11_03920 [Chloroflexi bacterium]|nr:MAG: hypothetical protein CSA11_03920 [Chloroflexota bacterium]
MSLLALLKQEAVKRHLLAAEANIDAATAFYLVRDMPYIRASSREPETILREWRGTCSGKHYTLKALFAELGIASQVMACTDTFEFKEENIHESLKEALANTDMKFVDVHNYLVLNLAEGDMVVDATWPLDSKKFGTVVNEEFVLGQSQQIACEPIQTWVVPEDRDAQDFKDELLRTNFSQEELVHRDRIIKLINSIFQEAYQV